jgi:cell wall-associated NlpC family hydrolase
MVVIGYAKTAPAIGATAPHHAAAGHQAQIAVAYATARVGHPYVWGGTGPDGYDCSGLVMMAWRSAGVSIPRTSQDQWKALPHIRASQLRPGDLIFYAGADGTTAAPGHVVMFIGHGQVAQAYSTRYPLMVTSLAGDGAGTPVGYARPAG